MCFECGESGHKAWKCDVRKARVAREQGRPGQQGQQSKGGQYGGKNSRSGWGPVCHNCEKRGHIRRNCPELQGSSGGGGGDAQKGSGGGKGDADSVTEVLQKQAELFQQSTEKMLEGLFARVSPSE